MPKSLIACLELRQKLKHYQDQDFAKTAGVVPVPKRADLARALKVSDGELKNWIDGRGDGGGDRIPVWVLDWLADQLVLFSEGRLNRAQARDLWSNCTPRDFQRQLRDKPTNDIMALLSAKKQELSVEVGEVSGDLGMFEEPFSPLAGERILNVRDKVRFEVNTRPGRCLVILASTPYHWYWMSPGISHPGPTKGGKEIIPETGEFMIGTRGPHRVIAIELNVQTPPYVRAREEPANLQPDMVRLLTEEILYCEEGRGWRWGEAQFFAENLGE